MRLPWKWIGWGTLAILIAGTVVWVLIPRPTISPAPAGAGSFGTSNVNVNIGTTPGTNIPGSTLSAIDTSKKIFELSSGPVAGAGFIQVLHPTTTLARWINADNGHAFEVALDSPGAVPHSISNTTIPGLQSSRWVPSGLGVLFQYLNNSVAKTGYLSYQSATSTSGKIFFYPDGITSIAISPDGTSAAYLLNTALGSDGYTSKIDGTASKKVFSLPLSQVRLSWPAQGTLLAYSAPATSVPGILFAIDAKSGNVTPLLYGLGLTATADASFAHIMYQTADSARTTYDHTVSSGAERSLSFAPFPEKCISGGGNTLLCAVPLAYVPPNYLDLWHQGTLSAADSIVRFDLSSGTSTIIASPGSATDGGSPADMLSLSISPDGRYLLYVSKNDRSLWGVRLSQ